MQSPEIFADEFEGGDGIGDGLLRMGCQHWQNISSATCATADFLAGISSRSSWDVELTVKFDNGRCYDFGDTRSTPVKIIDTHFVAVADAFGESSAQIRIEDVDIVGMRNRHYNGSPAGDCVVVLVRTPGWAGSGGGVQGPALLSG